MKNLIFEAGRNIAIKIPMDVYEDTLSFYRDILLMDTEEVAVTDAWIQRSTKVDFGTIVLWLDGVPSAEPSTVYLEIQTNQLELALPYLRTNKVRMPAVPERLPTDAHWIQDPAGTVLLLRSISAEPTEATTP